MEMADPTTGLEELLRFYAEAGLDHALVETPVDRFAQAERRRGPEPDQPPAEAQPATPQPDRPNRPAVSGAAARGTAAVPDEGAVARAREAAATAETLDDLKAQLTAFDGCNLKQTAKNLCFADGNPQADIMFVGEAPGREEDMQGLPFVGRSGKLLDRMMAAIGLDRTSAYIANTIPWRPPGNRTPTPQETEICRPFIERQIVLANPKLIVALGGPATKALTGTTAGILSVRGRWLDHIAADGRHIPVMPTLHPAYLLRNPAQKRYAWRDFLEAKRKLNELANSG
jgi:uracil-DNA glycosylase